MRRCCSSTICCRKKGRRRLQGADYFPAHPEVAASPDLDKIVPHKIGLKENFICSGEDERGPGEVTGAVPGTVRQVTGRVMDGMTMTIARGRSRSSTIRRHSPQVIVLIASCSASRHHPAVCVPGLFEPARARSERRVRRIHVRAFRRHFFQPHVRFGARQQRGLFAGLGAACAGDRGGPGLARGADRREFLRQVLYVASIVSLGIPYVLYIVAWILLLGKAGPVNAFLQETFGGVGPTSTSIRSAV